MYMEESKNQRQASFFNIVMQNINELIFTYDVNGRITFVNKKVVEVTGYAPEEITGRDILDFVAADFQDQVKKEIFYRAIKGKSKSYLCPIRQKTGDYRLMELKSTPIFIDGRVTAVVVLANDISEQYKASETLAAEKELLTITLESIAEGVIATDTAGNVTLINATAGEITGWLPEKAKNQPVNEVLPLFDPHGEKRLNPLELSAYNKVTNGHFKLITTDGNSKIISGTSNVIRNPKGAIAGHILVFRDVTESLKNYAQKALSQKLASIGQLAAGFAHEINTPMQYIGDNIMFIKTTGKDIWQLLPLYQKLTGTVEKANLCPELITKIRHYEKKFDLDFLLAEIPQALLESFKGINQVNKLIQVMNSFSHPGAGKREFKDLNKGINDTITISRNEWKYVADLETELEPNLPLVSYDMHEINQVVLNMIINSAYAIKQAINKGNYNKGTIKIKTGADKNFVTITIADNGIGIPGNLIPKIFDPFFTTKEAGEGTGQGLAIAHHIIVTKHKGTLDVMSQAGKGAKFIIRLPLVNPEMS